jgi:hypothetical protein
LKTQDNTIKRDTNMKKSRFKRGERREERERNLGLEMDLFIE